MKQLIIIFFGVLISFTSYSQNSLSGLDSTNYKVHLLKIKNVDKKLVKKFSEREFQHLVDVIGSNYDTITNNNSRLIRNKQQLKKNNYKAFVYALDMIHYDNISSNSFTLVVVLKKNIIKDIYLHSLHISWAH